MNILIVKTSAIGDLLHTLPALPALRATYPAAHISWLVEEEASDLLLGLPGLDEVLVSRRKRWIKAFKAGERLATLKEIAAFIRQVRAREYDLLLDFQGLLKSSLFVALSRARRKVGFGRGMAHAEGSYLFLTERVVPVSMDTHAVDRELLLLAGIGIRPQVVDTTLPLGAMDHERAEALLAAHGLTPDQPMVAINPMTTWETKHWHSRGFAAVADHFQRQGLAVVFTGGQGDRGAIASILSQMQEKGAVALAGATTLRTLAALYARARALITTDTGPMHIAAAVRTPVVALFGPTAPWRTGPYGPGHQIVRAGLSCSPCFKRSCPLGTQECMQAITVAQVLNAAQQIPALAATARSLDFCP